MKRLASPGQPAYVVSTVTTYWWNHGIAKDILNEAKRRFGDLQGITLEKESSTFFGTRDNIFHIHRPAWQCLLFEEMIAKYCV